MKAYEFGTIKSRNRGKPMAKRPAKCEGCGGDGPWTLVNGEDRQHYCFTCLKLEVRGMVGIGNFF